MTIHFDPLQGLQQHHVDESLSTSQRRLSDSFSSSLTEMETAQSRSCFEWFVDGFNAFFDFCETLFFTIEGYIKRCFSCFSGGYEIALWSDVTCGTYSQYNVVRRQAIRLHPPGKAACPFIAAMAIEQYLTNSLNSSNDVDLAVLRGVGAVFRSFGAEIREDFFRSSDSNQMRNYLTMKMRELDQNPSDFDRILQERGNYQDWLEIQSYLPRLQEDVNWFRVAEMSGLNGNLIPTQEKAIYLQGLQALLQNSNGRVCGGLLTVPPNSYAVCIRKNEENEVVEVCFFNSHGCSETSGSAFFKKWTKESDTDNPLDQAAEFLASFCPWVAGRSTQFTITPLRIRN